jgi:hypothetical protein
MLVIRSALRYFSEDTVTGCMRVSVIDALEPVQVDEHQG